MAAFFTEMVRRCKGEAMARKQPDEALFKDVLHKMNAYRKQGELCDVVLIIGDRHFPAHRAVLSATCTFFECLFSCEMRERRQNEITLSELDPTVMEDVLDYLYTREVKVTEQNSQSILQSADFLLLAGLKETASSYIGSNLTLQSCLAVFNLADVHSCKDLKSEALRLIHTNFQELSETEEFCNLSSSQVKEIIGSEDLVIEREEFVLKALMNWYLSDSGREKELINLFQCICWNSVQECVTEILLELLPEQYRSQLKTRKCFENHGFVFVADHSYRSGYDNSEGNLQSFAYIPHKDMWYEIPPDAEVDDSDVIVFDKETMYILGQGQCWSFRENKMSQLKEPPIHVGQFGAVFLNGYLYILGGFDWSGGRHRRVKAVQRYDPRSNEWQLMSEMPTARSDFNAATDGQYLYAVGGKGDSPNFELNSAEHYDPSTDTWSSLPSMGEEMGYVRTCFNSVIAFDGNVLVCNVSTGDWVDGAYWLLYTAEDNTWHKITNHGFHHDVYEILNATIFEDNVHLFCHETLQIEDYLNRDSRKESVFFFMNFDSKTGNWKKGRSLKFSTPLQPYVDTNSGGPFYFGKALNQQGFPLE